MWRLIFFSFPSLQLHVWQAPTTAAAAAAINILVGQRDLMWRPVKHGYLQSSKQSCAQQVLEFSALRRPGGIYKSRLHSSFIAHSRKRQSKTINIIWTPLSMLSWSQLLRRNKVCRPGRSLTVDWEPQKLTGVLWQFLLTLVGTLTCEWATSDGSVQNSQPSVSQRRDTTFSPSADSHWALGPWERDHEQRGEGGNFQWIAEWVWSPTSGLTNKMCINRGKWHQR